MSRWFMAIPHRKMCRPAATWGRMTCSIRGRLQTHRWPSSHSSDACSGWLTGTPEVVSQCAVSSASTAIRPRRNSSWAMVVLPDPGLPVMRKAATWVTI